MSNRLRIAATLVTFCCTGAMAQNKPAAHDDRNVLEQILIQTYQPSIVGKQLMGVGKEADVRRAGTIVVIQRPGLYGSLLHSEPASSAITGLHAELFRGHKDYEVPVGERYYVTGVAVSSSTVLIALLSARGVPTQAGLGHLWTTLSFNFPDQVLADAEKDTVFRAIDQWFLPEGRAVSAAPGIMAVPASATPSGPVPVAAAYSPAQASTASQPGASSVVAASRETVLAIGMTRDQILQVLGSAAREIQFESKSWLIYPGIVAALNGGKLESVQTSGEGTARVNVQSDPAGAEIYLDEQLVGSTPSMLPLNPGKHVFRLHAPGRADWTRQVNVLSGSEISLSATLEKN